VSVEQSRSTTLESTGKLHRSILSAAGVRLIRFDSFVVRPSFNLVTSEGGDETCSADTLQHYMDVLLSLEREEYVHYVVG